MRWIRMSHALSGTGGLGERVRSARLPGSKARARRARWSRRIACARRGQSGGMLRGGTLDPEAAAVLPEAVGRSRGAGFRRNEKASRGFGTLRHDAMRVGRYSNSIVPQGLGVRSYKTRQMPSTSEAMRSPILLSSAPVELGHLGGHGVDGVDRADERRPLVERLSSLTPVTRKSGTETKYCHTLPSEAGCGEFLAQNGVGLAQRLKRSRVMAPRQRTPRPGPGRAGARPCSRKAELAADDAHLVFEEKLHRSHSSNCRSSGRPPTL